MASELTGPERAAVLLLHLNEETAGEVFRGLSRKEMKALTEASKKVKEFSPDQVEAVLESFIEEMRRGGFELQGGGDYISKLVEQSLGERAKEILGDEGSGLFEILGEIDPNTLVNILRKEHPQTAALIVAHLSSEKAGSVLGLLPEAHQSDVLRRLATLDTVNPDVLRLIEEALIQEFSVMGSGGSRKVGGIELAAEIMNQMEKSREQALMQELEEADEDLAEAIRGLMFVFDDLIRLDGGAIQTLLKEVERDILVLALKAADDDLKDHIFKNLSSRAVEMIIEDMETRGPVRLSDVERAQAEVVRTALALQASGAIEISTGGDDDALI